MDLCFFFICIQPAVEDSLGFSSWQHTNQTSLLEMKNSSVFFLVPCAFVFDNIFFFAFRDWQIIVHVVSILSFMCHLKNTIQLFRSIDFSVWRWFYLVCSSNLYNFYLIFSATFQRTHSPHNRKMTFQPIYTHILSYDMRHPMLTELLEGQFFFYRFGILMKSLRRIWNFSSIRLLWLSVFKGKWFRFICVLVDSQFTVTISQLSS